MATLTMRKPRGRRRHRSLEEEARELLCDVATGRVRQSLRDLADRIAVLTPDVPQTDSTELVRDGRD
jgi:hypothetical protein